MQFKLMESVFVKNRERERERDRERERERERGPQGTGGPY